MPSLEKFAGYQLAPIVWLPCSPYSHDGIFHSGIIQGGLVVHTLARILAEAEVRALNSESLSPWGQNYLLTACLGQQIQTVVSMELSNIDQMDI